MVDPQNHGFQYSNALILDDLVGTIFFPKPPAVGMCKLLRLPCRLLGYRELWQVSPPSPEGPAGIFRWFGTPIHRQMMFGTPIFFLDCSAQCRLFPVLVETKEGCLGDRLQWQALKISLAACGGSRVDDNQGSANGRMATTTTGRNCPMVIHNEWLNHHF